MKSMCESSKWNWRLVDGWLTLSPIDTLCCRAFCLLTEPGIGAIGRVWSAAEASGLRVVAARMVNLSNEDADIVSGGVGGNVSAGAVLALNMMGDDAASKTQALTSHVHERAGTPRNSLLAAVDEGANAALTNGFFGDAKQRLKSARELSGTFADCACALVLPGALSGGQAGSILTEIQDRIAGTDIKISALRSVALTRSQAEEFYEVYKAVVPEYVVSHHCSGGWWFERGDSTCSLTGVRHSLPAHSLTLVHSPHLFVVVRRRW